MLAADDARGGQKIDVTVAVEIGRGEVPLAEGEGRGALGADEQVVIGGVAEVLRKCRHLGVRLRGLIEPGEEGGKSVHIGQSFRPI